MIFLFLPLCNDFLLCFYLLSLGSLQNITECWLTLLSKRQMHFIFFSFFEMKLSQKNALCDFWYRYNMDKSVFEDDNDISMPCICKSIWNVMFVPCWLLRFIYKRKLKSNIILFVCDLCVFFFCSQSIYTFHLTMKVMIGCKSVITEPSNNNNKIVTEYDERKLVALQCYYWIDMWLI